MQQYRYKHYLKIAFWNSLVAVLCACVVVLIIVYGWQGLQNVLSSVMGLVDGEPTAEIMSDEARTLELLGKLEAQAEADSASVDEQSAILEQLEAQTPVRTNQEASTTSTNGSTESAVSNTEVDAATAEQMRILQQLENL